MAFQLATNYCGIIFPFSQRIHDLNSLNLVREHARCYVVERSRTKVIAISRTLHNFINSAYNAVCGIWRQKQAAAVRRKA